MPYGSNSILIDLRTGQQQTAKAWASAYAGIARLCRQRRPRDFGRAVVRDFVRLGVLSVARVSRPNVQGAPQ